MDHIEAKREQARQHKGVWYDVRADKFVAEVYSKGDRHFLGHFTTADEAADAYAKARAELPSGRDGDDTFVQAFNSFLDTAARDQKGSPLQDEIMTYKGQQFYFEGVVFRSMNNRKRPFFNWLSTCACGKTYHTLTATTTKAAKGITRTCEEHRAGGRKPMKTKAQADTAEAPADWIDAATTALDALSLVSDSFGIEAFLSECRVVDPTLPRAFNRFVLESPQSPVVLKDGMLFPRDV